MTTSNVEYITLSGNSYPELMSQVLSYRNKTTDTMTCWMILEGSILFAQNQYWATMWRPV